MILIGTISVSITLVGIIGVMVIDGDGIMVLIIGAMAIDGDGIMVLITGVSILIGIHIKIM
jgi:hypothetical protein